MQNSPAPIPWTAPFTLRLVPLTSRYAAFAENADAIIDHIRQATQDGIDAIAFPSDSIAGAPADDPYLSRPAVAAALRAQTDRVLAPRHPSAPILLGLDDTQLADLELTSNPFPFAYPFPAIPADSPLLASSAPLLIRLNRLALDGRDAATIHPGAALIRDPAHGPVLTPFFDPRPIDVLLERTPDAPPSATILTHPTRPASDAPLANLSALWSALVFALRAYADQNHFPGALIALSGGIDSALVATLAVDALGPARVFSVTMPSAITSSETLSDALDLAHRLHIPCLTLPIAPSVDALRTSLDAALDAGGGTWPASPLPSPLPNSLMPENLQARVRGTLLMSLSNLCGHLVLATSNRSESLTGYSTLYGDMCGGYAPIADLPKTLVFELSRWRNTQPASPSLPAGVEPIPPSTIERPPSAELRPGQKDSDSLPPYDLLDPLLDAYVDRARPLPDLSPDRPTALSIQRLVLRSEYKRRQAAPHPLLRHPAPPPFPLLSSFRE